MSTIHFRFRATVFIALRTLAVIAALSSMSLLASPRAFAGDATDRSSLPIAEPAPPTITEQDARKVQAPARFEVKAPASAPNVIVVLVDDFGFGQSRTFGGPVEMPTLQQLADGGLRYNRFHTTALCSPTRTALLTGRNHHVNNAGAFHRDKVIFQPLETRRVRQH